MRRKLLVKRKIKRRREAILEGRSAFTHLRNRTIFPGAEDLIKAGYPEVVVPIDKRWRKLREVATTTFVDEQGRETFMAFANRFFFLTEEDAHVFRALQYMV